MPTDVDEFFDEDEEKESLFKLLWPFLLFGFRKGISDTSSKVDEQDVLTAGIQAAIKSQAFEKAGLITGTTKDILKAKLATAIAEGQSVAQFSKTIHDVYGQMTKPRSDAIARTEITGSLNNGVVKTLEAEGHQEKAWSTVIDGRERETHAQADGQTVPIDHPFHVGGASGMYPGDPMFPAEEVINCRCTLVAPNTPSDRKQVINERFLRTHGALERKLVVSLRREFDAQKRRILSQFPS